jgi:hypothetical protein
MASRVSGRGSWDESLCEIEVGLTLELEREPEERLRAEGTGLAWGGRD